MITNEFCKYLWEVWEISGARQLQVDFARSMFLADARTGTNENTEADYDFSAIKAEWDSFSAEEQDEIIGLYTLISYGFYTKMCNLYREGKKDEFVEMVTHPDVLILASARYHLSRNATWSDVCADYGIDPETTQPISWKKF